MPSTPRVRDAKLLDALEALGGGPVKRTVWRVVRQGRDPCLCSQSGGRWDDGTFDVLYTAFDRDGAVAEMDFHRRKGQPIPPSKPAYALHALFVSFENAVTLPTLDSLAALGVDAARYGRLAYQERQAEYPRTQDIAEAAHFLGHDGLIAPNARFDCLNAVLFCDAVSPDAYWAEADHGPVDFAAWRAARP
ncbi:MAG: RES family NAD+ phosphorylase [Alphaproteobacteria bacterium]|nr:RES family NAD+ phosphorylase [Alphaproteobacteria bacterium]